MQVGKGLELDAKHGRVERAGPLVVGGSHLEGGALADREQTTVCVVLSREDVVRLGAKRPPIAAGVRASAANSRPSDSVRGLRPAGSARASAMRRRSSDDHATRVCDSSR